MLVRWCAGKERKSDLTEDHIEGGSQMSRIPLAEGREEEMGTSLVDAFRNNTGVYTASPISI